MRVYTLYDVVHTQTSEVILEGLGSYEEATEAAFSMNLEHSDYQIIQRKVSTIRPGFGRDPDLS